jgi:hypothetical protein
MNLYAGSTCTKPVDGSVVHFHTLPELQTGTVYVAAIVKAGLTRSVAIPNNIFDATHNKMPFPGTL